MKNALYQYDVSGHKFVILNDCYGRPKKIDIFLKENNPEYYVTLFSELGELKPYIADKILILDILKKFKLLYYLDENKLYITIKHYGADDQIKTYLEAFLKGR